MPDKKKNKILLIACVMIAITIFVMFLYTDVMETTRDGITFWTALFTGRIREFYCMNSNVVISNQFGISTAAIYDLPVYIMTAIWNLPLWIYEKVTGLYALDNIVGVLWAKAISLPYLFGVYCCVIKIGKMIKGEMCEKELVAMEMLTSIFLFTPVLVMGQYDAMALFFIMLGCYYYIQGNNRLFILWFAVAMPFKLFAMFVYIPLILLKEKKVVKVIIEFLLGSSFLIFCKIIQGAVFIQDTSGADYLSDHLLTFIFQSQLGLVYGSSSIFFVLFILVCFFCYFKETPNEKEIGKWAIYVSLLGLLSFFIGSLTHPQWSLLLLPFCALCVCCADKEQVKNGMLIETVFSTGLLLSQLIYYYWVFNIKTGVYTVAGKLFYDGQKDLSYSVRDILGKIAGMDAGNLNLIGGGVFLAGVICFLFWSYPDRREIKFAQTDLSNRALIGIRLLLIGIVSVILIGLML